MAARKVHAPGSPGRLAAKQRNKDLLHAYQLEREAMGLPDLTSGILTKRGRYSGIRQSWDRLHEDMRSLGL